MHIYFDDVALAKAWCTFFHFYDVAMAKAWCTFVFRMPLWLGPGAHVFSGSRSGSSLVHILYEVLLSKRPDAHFV